MVHCEQHHIDTKNSNACLLIRSEKLHDVNILIVIVIMEENLLKTLNGVTMTLNVEYRLRGDGNIILFKTERER